jgi:hypothetical protein
MFDNKREKNCPFFALLADVPSFMRIEMASFFHP